MSINTNEVTLVGKIESGFTFNHQFFGEGFYATKVSIARKSGIVDYIPVIVSERLMDTSENYTGMYIHIHGELRSYNRTNRIGESKLKVFVAPKSCELLSEEDFEAYGYTNKISLEGYVCKPIVYRKTPLTERPISDVMVAVNRTYRKCDYVPCICWNDDAHSAYTFNEGYRIKLNGRIQSREYVKKLNETEEITRTTYEVSMSKLELVSTRGAKV